MQSSFSGIVRATPAQARFDEEEIEEERKRKEKESIRIEEERKREERRVREEQLKKVREEEERKSREEHRRQEQIRYLQSVTKKQCPISQLLYTSVLNKNKRISCNLELYKHPCRIFGIFFYVTAYSRFCNF